MATVEEFLVLIRIANGDVHRLVPAIGNADEARIQRGAQAEDQSRQRIGEVFVFAATEAMAGHDDTAAELSIGLIAGSQRRAFFRR